MDTVLKGDVGDSTAVDEDVKMSENVAVTGSDLAPFVETEAEREVDDDVHFKEDDGAADAEEPALTQPFLPENGSNGDFEEVPALGGETCH